MTRISKYIHTDNVIMCSTKPLSLRQAAFSTSAAQKTSLLSAKMNGDSCIDSVEGL
jgi:hypothetical protein